MKTLVYFVLVAASLVLGGCSHLEPADDGNGFTFRFSRNKKQEVPLKPFYLTPPPGSCLANCGGDTLFVKVHNPNGALVAHTFVETEKEGTPQSFILQPDFSTIKIAAVYSRPVVLKVLYVTKDGVKSFATPVYDGQFLASYGEPPVVNLPKFARK